MRNSSKLKPIRLKSYKSFSSSFRCETTKKGNDTTISKAHPRVSASFISRLFFCWITPLMKLGYTRELNEIDLYKALPEDESHALGMNLEEEWTKELNKKDNSSKPSLIKAAIRLFGLRYMLLSLVPLLDECILRILQPFLLGKLIRYFEPGSDMTKESAYLYGTMIILCSFLCMVCENTYTIATKHIGIKLRTACCSLLFRKCLRLNVSAQPGQKKRSGSIGQIVNLMSNDVNRLESVVFFIHYFWISPLQASIATFFLYSFVGPSSLVGVALMLLLIPIQGCIGKAISKLRIRVAQRTDERVQAVNEVVSGIRVIKLYAWEKSFVSLVHTFRRMEMNVIRRAAYLTAFFKTVYQTSHKLNIFVTLCAYIFLGNSLSPEKVFVTVAFFNNIRLGMGAHFNLAIFGVAESIVSIRRIQDFLLLDEVSSTINNLQNKKENTKNETGTEPFIVCNQATVKWPHNDSKSISSDDETSSFTLKNVSFSVKFGEMIAITGRVGSGKSLLLNMLLGELVPLKGNCETNGRLAVATQLPWIFSGSVLDNILCGLDYNEKRYFQVVEASALKPDLMLFPNGDHTLVGEKGISLSGGQKARINLARCLYVDADIYLFDDPLSAVDANVGRHIYDKAINGFLRDKIRVLVTHQVQLLSETNQVIHLEGGTARLVESDVEIASLKCKPLDEDMNTMSENSPPDATKRSINASQVQNSQQSNNQNDLSPQESRGIGAITLSLYWKYFSASGRPLFQFMFVGFWLIAQAFTNGSHYWLSIWTQQSSDNQESIYNNSSHSLFGENVSGSQQDQIWLEKGVYIYIGLIGGMFFFTATSTGLFFVICTMSAVKLHNKMFSAIIRSPMNFFDQNPSGRVLNRFSKDVGCMDDSLPPTFFDVIEIMCNMIGIFIVTTAVNIWFCVPVIVFLLGSYQWRRIYIRTSLSLRRLEATSRSPVFSHVSDSILGLITLRAHRLQTSYQRMFDERQDSNTTVYYLFSVAGRWFSVGLHFTLIFYVSCVVFICVALRKDIGPNEAGLVLTTLLTVSNFHFGALQSAETENHMTSVERVMEYGQLPAEAPLESNQDKKPAKDWPMHGKIRFDRMSLRYGQTNQPVLKNISCTVEAQEKVGIVGRTGAGKSSLITALFRLVEPEGEIYIDGVDTKTIGLHDLRSRISIIPQDPFLFSGSLRKNLDPFGNYDDAKLWKAVEDVKLKESMGDTQSFCLDFVVAEGGSNLSVGQRQLVCLARAILRQNKILVLDEATANVDHRTDNLIQNTVREKFKDCTVLTIAHRLNTILDSDRIMVIDNGNLLEFEKPKILIRNSQSIFYRMVEQGRLLEFFNTNV